MSSNWKTGAIAQRLIVGIQKSKTANKELEVVFCHGFSMALAVLARIISHQARVRIEIRYAQCVPLDSCLAKVLRFTAKTFPPSTCVFHSPLRPESILRHFPTSFHPLTFVPCIAFVIMVGCSPRYEARVYDAPKTETEFVREPPAMASSPRQSPPMMGASTIPLSERRILGAVIPYKDVAYFLKATDKTERLALAESDFRTVVERFAIDTEKREMNFQLPQNWTSKWRDDGGQFNVIAEFNVKAGSGEPIKFTVTELSKPADVAAWDSYLLVNINRWRGQLQLPETDLVAIRNELPSIKREGFALPATIFDATGAGNAASTGAGNAASPPTPASTSLPTPESPLKLAYEKPDSWEIQAAKPFRLATFKIANSERSGEVVVSLAKDSPVPNAEMWFEQVLQRDDKAIIRPLATKSVNEAEEIQAGTRPGKLYSIRSGDEATAPVLLVAAIPTGENELCLFVKLKSDLRTSEEQKSNLLSFVNSLRWE